MKQKKIPLRMCVVTKERYEKKELLRVVRTPDGDIFIDKSGKQNGKGAYIKKDREVINKARKNKALDRALEVSIPDTIYEEIISIIEKEGEVNV